MKLVKVFNSISINEVNFVRTLLEVQGIDAVVFDEATAAFAPHVLFHQGGPRVMVRDVDLNAAQTVVEEYWKTKQESNKMEGEER